MSVGKSRAQKNTGEGFVNGSCDPPEVVQGLPKEKLLLGIQLRLCVMYAVRDSFYMVNTRATLKSIRQTSRNRCPVPPFPLRQSLQRREAS
jgi:hypothetical protein